MIEQFFYVPDEAPSKMRAKIVDKRDPDELALDASDIFRAQGQRVGYGTKKG